MALQHFYTRVPAKISIFNRADSFDTFAMSDGLDRDFVTKDLMPVCEMKQTAKDLDLVRQGLIAPTYYQGTTKDGVLIQSQTTYIPLDYTGERSSYFVHSLVYSEEEKNKLFSSQGMETFNKKMFINNLKQFNLGSPETKPIHDFPATSFVEAKGEDPAWILNELGKDNMFRFIYATLVIFSGRTKSVFFTFGKDDLESSDYALRFLNSFLEIMPYHLRPHLSFVTRLSDTTKMQNVKLKCLAQGTPDAQLQKGVTLNFAKKTLTGIGDQEVLESKVLIEFFCQLLMSESLRNEFLTFASKAVELEPSYAKPQLKCIQDLVFMFKVSSGLYPENQVLPDDNAVLEFFQTYDKFRGAMTDQYRMNAVKCLKRYPVDHKEIPKQVFSKVAKVYQTEPECVKQVIMGVVLDMIHTDIMRDKLFKFIIDNYELENEETKHEIIMNISRVFYGGFLQNKIVDFFAQIYPNEPTASKEEIVKKFLLAIRTKDVQEKILYFIDTNYDNLSENSKKNLYEAILENIHDGDQLALNLIWLAEKRLENEDESIKEFFAKGFITELENEQKRKEHPLIKLVAKAQSKFFDAIVLKIFNEWSQRKIFGDFVRFSLEGGLKEKIKAIENIWARVGTMDDEVLERFEKVILADLDVPQARTDVIALINLEGEMTKSFMNYGKNGVKFIGFFSENIFQKYMQNSLYSVFSHTGEDAVGILYSYAKHNRQLGNCEAFKPIRAYIEFEKAIKERNVYKLITKAESLPVDPRYRGLILSYLESNMNTILSLKKDEDNSVAVTEEDSSLVEFAKGDIEMFDIALKSILCYLRSGSINFMSVYQAIVPKLGNDTEGKKKLFGKAELTPKQLLALRIRRFAGFVNLLVLDECVSAQFGELVKDSNTSFAQVKNAVNEGLGKKEIALLDEELAKIKL